MSSHHFVKEQQEPAVFILETEEIHLETIGPMLEWVPTLLVTEKAIEKVLSWGIKIDVVIATADFQAANQHLLEEQYPIRFLTATEGNELSEGLHYLKATAHQAAHLVGFSHRNVENLEQETDEMNLTLIDGNWKYYPVKDGKFKKWFAASTLHIHGREGSALELKNADGEMILPIAYATMIDIPEGITEIQSPHAFWIGEQVG